MQFDALDDATLANARALNHAFLELAISEQRPVDVSESLAGSIRGLSVVERNRLAATPFLLFRLGQFDAGQWRAEDALSRRDPDLFRVPMARGEWQLVTATLGVVWALARTNRYAARCLSGSGIEWCDYAARMPLSDLIMAASTFESLVQPRACEGTKFWRTLVVSASDHRQFVRRAARFSALQCVLTTRAEGVRESFRKAACKRRDVITRA